MPIQNHGVLRNSTIFLRISAARFVSEAEVALAVIPLLGRAQLKLLQNYRLLARKKYPFQLPSSLLPKTSFRSFLSPHTSPFDASYLLS